MRNLRRRVGISPFRRVRSTLSTFLVVAFVAATLIGASAAFAQTATIEGSQEQGFGRILLTFERETPVSARSVNGVLIVTFGNETEVRGDRLPQQMPGYVSIVRHDPGGAGLRMALTQNFRANVLPAGELVFIDLLPERWTGLPPGLPPSVVAELARRAQEAESRLAAEEARRRDSTPRPLPVRVAELPTLARLIFDPSTPAAISDRIVDDRVELRFSEPFELEPERALRTLPGVQRVETRLDEGATYVTLSLARGFSARGFHEEQGFVVDIEPMERESAEIDLVASPEARRPAPGEGPRAAPDQRGEETVGASETTQDVSLPAKEEEPDAQASAAADPPAPSAIPLAQARGVAHLEDDRVRIDFVFGDQPPAAVFQHAGILRAVFHTPTPLVMEPIPDEARDRVEIVETVREGAFVILGLRPLFEGVARLAPQADGWKLTIGEEPDVPALPLVVHRDIDERGATSISVALEGASGVHWFEAPETGERIAVVTAGGEARNIPGTQRFVEFTLPATAHGVAVVAHADDLIARVHGAYVLISRPQGLVLSEIAGGDRARSPLPEKPVFDRVVWEEAQRGAVREALRGLMNAVVSARPTEKTMARLDLARAMLANGLASEAVAALRVAGADDPGVRGDRRFALLLAGANVALGRLAEARAALAEPALATDAEGELWRAYLAALEGHPRRALEEFRKARPMLEAYPDDLQGRMRVAMAQAALAENEFEIVERELATIGLLAPGSVPRNESALIRAQLELVYGRTDVALSALSRIMEEGARPLAARARLYWTERALKEGDISVEDAIAALETLAVSWRGDEVELRALARLADLYAREGRWRDVFLAARSANRNFPDHPVSRDLNEDASRLFDEIYLGGLDEGMSRVQAIGLFFDFPEFLPIGRRGDEIVRQLSDRLVELGLVDNAAELLRHQVENRLQGAAKATVAARLATLYLMEGAPLAAREVLRDTRLPGLPETIARARMLLEARALSDLARVDLALELLEGEEGPEVDRLRADIHWSASRWREAGEAHEAMVADRWRDPAPLSPRERTDVMRAAIAYTLADEQLALDRLRANFFEPMSQSEDARVFALATTPDVQSTAAFREIADRVTGSDTLLDFLEEYRRRYPDMAAPPRGTPSGAAPRPSASGRTGAEPA
ncbi:MAG: hypothetical protein EA385_13415 [Salinarimonadaceae bacterium]|nr:MAG: hypothetical protein EA385_13415 [Salinarimonadaceae bacterium]